MDKDQLSQVLERDYTVLTSYVEQNGYKENLGQTERRAFAERVAKSRLSYPERARMLQEYDKMLDEI